MSSTDFYSEFLSEFRGTLVTPSDDRSTSTSSDAFAGKEVVSHTTISLSSRSDSSPPFENFGLQRKDSEGSVLGLTKNQALTYKKTGSKCLDLFNDVMPYTSREDLSDYLKAAWEEDALSTLKIIFQLGDPRKGKSDIKNLHQSLLWLYDNHFETLMLNIQNVGNFSYHKSLLELMVLGVHGSDALDDKRGLFYEW